jgi:hypothetical protein
MKVCQIILTFCVANLIADKENPYGRNFWTGLADKILLNTYGMLFGNHLI